jgi:hypothetical protein
MFNILKGLGSIKEPVGADFARIVPYKDLYDQFLVDKFGCVHRWYSIDAPLADVASPGELIHIQRQLVNFVEKLPDPIIQVQWNFTSTGDYGDLIVEHGDYSCNYQILNWLRQERVKHFLKENRERTLRRSGTTLILSCLPTKTGNSKKRKGVLSEEMARPGAGLGRIPAKAITREDFYEAIATLRAADVLLEESLGRAAIKARPMGPEQIADYLYRLFNQELAWDMGLPVVYDYDSTELNSAWICDDPTFGRDHLRFGGYLHAFVSLTKKPLQTVPLKDIDRLTSQLGFADFRVVLNVRRLDPLREIEKFQAKRNALVGALKLSPNLVDKLWNPMRRASDREMEANVEVNQDIKELNRLIEGMRAGKDYLTAIQLVVHFWAKDLRELSARRAQIMAKIGALDGARGYPERTGTRWIFESSLPASVEAWQRPQKVSSSMAADLTPLQAGFEGRGKPVCLMRNTTGGLVTINLHDSSDVNAPFCFITGASGSGKSFLLIEIIKQHMIGNSCLYALDGSGASCAPIIELIGGKILRLSADPVSGEEPFCFNPLEIYGVRSTQRVVREPTPAQVSRMANCIYAMILSTRKSGEIVNAEEQNLIARGISVSFAQARKRQEPAVYMRNLLHLFEQEYRKEAAGLIEAIRPFTRGQPLGRWFDGPTTIDLDSEVLLFDLTGIRKNKPLAAAMVPLLTNYIHDLVTRDPGVTKIIPMDELWEMILNEQLMELVIESVKAWRKMGAIVIGCTQSLFDLEKSPHVVSAIKQNTDTWLLMDQGSGDEPQYARDFLELTMGQYDILTTLRRANRVSPEGKLEVYREMLMIRGRGESGTSGRVRVSVSPVDYWLATTKAKEIKLRKEARAMFNGDLRQAIVYLAEKYPGGTEVEDDRKSTSNGS